MGARATGLGGAYAAVGRDVTSLHYNPAGFGLLPGRQVALTHAALFQGVSYDYLGYAQNLPKAPGGWGVELLRLGVGDVEGRDANNQSTGGISYSELGLGAGAGVRGLLLPKLSVGAGLKVVQRSLAGSKDRLIGMDLGTQYGPLWDGRLDLGLGLTNLVSLTMGDTEDKLPFKARFAGSVRVIGGLSLVFQADSDAVLRMGTEYAFGIVAMRAGYTPNGFSFGGGVTLLKSVALDLAIQDHSKLGPSQFISLQYRFSKGSAHLAYASDYLRRYEEALKDQDYMRASDNLQIALAMDSALAKAWGERARRLKKLLEGMDLASHPTVQETLMKKGEQGALGLSAAAAFIQGEMEKSMLLAHAALGSDPSQVAYELFLRALSKETGLAIRPNEILPLNALVQEKLARANASFFAQRYQDAAHECRYAILLNPQDTLAWMRLGSAFFAMGDSERARKAYERVLQFDPSNEPTRRFMEQQGWR